MRKGDKPPKPRSQDKPSAAAEVKAKIAGYRSCLERQGAKPGSLPAPSGNSDGLGSLPKDVQERIAKLRQAAAACGDRLPKGAPIGDDPGSGLRKLREDAKQRFKGVQTFRDCMGRHGYGPTANGTKPSGSLKQAFDDCRPAGQ